MRIFHRALVLVLKTPVPKNEKVLGAGADEHRIFFSLVLVLKLQVGRELFANAFECEKDH